MRIPGNLLALTENKKAAFSNVASKPVGSRLHRGGRARGRPHAREAMQGFLKDDDGKRRYVIS